jgi:hypothetical protein
LEREQLPEAHPRLLVVKQIRELVSYF